MPDRPRSASCSRPSRRRLLSRSGQAVATGVLLAGTRGLPAARLGANDKVRLGWIGCGGRGLQLLDAFKQLPELCTVVGACDVHAGRARAFKQRAEQEPALGKPDVYGDYRELLARKDLDAVIVPTTCQWHCLPTLDACKAGKDVYVEKPLAWSIGEGQKMVEAARKYDRIVVVGCQQRSTPSFQEAVAFIQSGKLGKIGAVRSWNLENVAPNGFGSPPAEPPPAELDWNFWVGPAPMPEHYQSNYFFHHYWYWAFGGGWQSEWAVHHHDVINWAMGVQHPLSAAGSGGIYVRKDNLQLPDTFEAVYEYPGFLSLYSFRHCNAHFHEESWYGMAFYGENGTLVVNRQFWKVIPEPIALHDPAQQGKLRMDAGFTRPGTPGEGHPQHQRAFLEAIKAHRPYAPADVEQGHFASIPGHLANIAYRLGRKIHWDAASQTCKGDAEANAMLTRPYRAPWKLEV